MVCNYCNKPTYARGMCSTHYQRSTGKSKTPMSAPCLQDEPSVRYARLVGPADINGCISWVGSINGGGYGTFNYDGRNLAGAHQWAWIQKHGPIPESFYICHKCDNRLCVNVEHLFMGTPTDNYNDMVNKGRKVQVKGEEVGCAKLTEDNVREIRKMRANGETKAAIARHFQVSHITIRKVLDGRRWGHVK